MKVKELRELLSKLPDDYEVFYKFRPAAGNIGEVWTVYEDTFGFFGREIPCVLMDAWSKEIE